MKPVASKSLSSLQAHFLIPDHHTLESSDHRRRHVRRRGKNWFSQMNSHWMSCKFVSQLFFRERFRIPLHFFVSNLGMKVDAKMTLKWQRFEC
jgi:hypothetical protein